MPKKQCFPQAWEKILQKNQPTSPKKVNYTQPIVSSVILWKKVIKLRINHYKLWFNIVFFTPGISAKDGRGLFAGAA